MGRYKFDKFTLEYLSPSTVQAIKIDLVKNANIDATEFDWRVAEIRVKRANKAQRHRFVESLEKLKKYSDENDIYGVSIPCFARITGRNIKTVRDWVDKKFIPVFYAGYISPRAFIVIEDAIKSLNELINYEKKLPRS